MAFVVVGIVGLTIAAVVTTPPQEETAVATNLTDQIALGQDLFSVNCVECHGAEGEGGEIKGVEGLEGVILNPINSKDVMYTLDDESLYNIIDYGQPDLGMTPFGKGYGGELARADINNIVTFMRYTWDDRAELPAEAAAVGAIPTLTPNEIPSYDVHVEPILKRYCISCHRPGKENNNYIMLTYEDLLATGDHTPNIITGDLNSNLLLMINRQEIEAGGPMPPTKALKPELIDIITRWVLAGMPKTAEEAALLSASPTPLSGEITGTPLPTPESGTITATQAPGTPTP